MWNSVTTWWQSPYSDSMSVPKWFLFVGLLLLLGVVWSIIIKHLAID